MKEIAMFFYKINSKLEKIKFLAAIKQGYTILMPIFIIGAFSILLQYFPLLLVKDFNLCHQFCHQLIHFLNFNIKI